MFSVNVRNSRLKCCHLIFHDNQTYTHQLLCIGVEWEGTSKARASSIRVIRIIFLESYARILTYETLSYVNHIVAWYFRPVQGSSSLDFNHETFTQNRNSFAKSNTPLLPVYLKQIFLRIPAILRRLLTCRLCLEVPRPSGYWCLLWRPSIWTLSFLPTCVYIRVWSSTGPDICPFWEKYFSGKHHEKFGHFVNFSWYIFGLTCLP